MPFTERHTRPLAVFAVAVVLPLAVAACSGGSSKSAAPAGSSSPAPAVTTPATASSNNSSSDSAFCAQRSGFAAMLGPNDQGPDTAKLKADLENALAHAPAAIKSDLQELADVELPILNGQVTSQSQVEQEMGSPQLQKAVKDISLWVQSHCG